MRVNLKTEPQKDVELSLQTGRISKNQLIKGAAPWNLDYATRKPWKIKRKLENYIGKRILDKKKEFKRLQRKRKQQQQHRKKPCEEKIEPKTEEEQHTIEFVPSKSEASLNFNLNFAEIRSRIQNIRSSIEESERRRFGFADAVEVREYKLYNVLREAGFVDSLTLLVKFLTIGQENRRRLFRNFPDYLPVTTSHFAAIVIKIAWVQYKNTKGWKAKLCRTPINAASQRQRSSVKAEWEKFAFYHYAARSIQRG